MSSNGLCGSGEGRRRNDLGVPRDNETIVGYGPRSANRLDLSLGRCDSHIDRLLTSQLVRVPTHTFVGNAPVSYLKEPVYS
jgi:hypothetical protein